MKFSNFSFYHYCQLHQFFSWNITSDKSEYFYDPSYSILFVTYFNFFRSLTEFPELKQIQLSWFMFTLKIYIYLYIINQIVANRPWKDGIIFSFVSLICHTWEQIIFKNIIVFHVWTFLKNSDSQRRENIYWRKTGSSAGPYVDIVHCVESIRTVFVVRYILLLVCRSGEQPAVEWSEVYTATYLSH